MGYFGGASAPTRPAGFNGQLQFNDGGAFGADVQLAWDKTGKRLGIGSNAPAFKLDVNGPLHVVSPGETLAGTTTGGGALVNIDTGFRFTFQGMVLGIFLRSRIGSLNPGQYVQNNALNIKRVG